MEFKESASDSLARALVAFANAEGGRVYVGVADDKSVKGADVSNRALSQIQDTARHCDPPVRIELVPFKHGGSSVLMIEVPEGTQKPYGCSDGYFLRTGPNSQKMNRDELLRFVRAQGQVSFDETPCRDFRYPADFGIEAFENFLAVAKVKPGGVKREDLLVNMGAAKLHGKSLVFNNAGVLFFAKRPRLFHIQSRITCLLFEGTQRTTILDRKEHDGVIAENVDGAMTFLRRHLPLRYEITGLRRKEIPAIPQAALREALLNAVIHRDYFERGGAVMVEISRDKVEIINPGGLVPGLRLENLGRRSLPRNPLIADLFFRMDEGEKAGTGIGRIREAISQAGLPAPIFAADSFFSVKFPLPATPGHVPSRLGPSQGTQSGPSWDPVGLGAQAGTKSALSGDQAELLRLCRIPQGFSRLMIAFGRTNRTKFRQSVLKPMLSAGLIAVTIPDKPHSRFQKYTTTKSGIALLGKNPD